MTNEIIDLEAKNLSEERLGVLDMAITFLRAVTPGLKPKDREMGALITNCLLETRKSLESEYIALSEYKETKFN